MKYLATIAGREYRLDVRPAGRPGAYTVSIDGAEREVEIERTASGWLYSLLVDSRAYDVGRSGGSLLVDGRAYEVGIERDLGLRRAHGAAAGGPATVRAPIPGLVVAVHVKPGDQVEAGQTLAIVEAMKMQMELKSPRAGTVSAVNIEPGQEVSQGQVLAAIAE